MTRQARSSHPKRSCPSGFMLFELLLTAFVIGTAFLAGTWSMNATARTAAAYEQAAGPAPFLAREILALADGLPRTPSGATGVTSGAAVIALNSLIGASFSPPILGDGSVAPGMNGWRQNVALSVYALDGLTTPTTYNPAAGLPPDSSKLYKLDVSILHDGQVVDGFSWWLHP